jgi:hypothetical protein
MIFSVNLVRYFTIKTGVWPLGAVVRFFPVFVKIVFGFG